MDGLNFFMPGQLWQYATREGEENSTLTVLKIDELENDTIIHIRIDDIKLAYADHIIHLPFSVEAIEVSVTGFIKHLDKVPGFEEGYKEWKKVFDSGKGGYWQMTVRDVLDAISTMMNEKAKGV